jgi:hypothetical protein
MRPFLPGKRSLRFKYFARRNISWRYTRVSYSTVTCIFRSCSCLQKSFSFERPAKSSGNFMSWALGRSWWWPLLCYPLLQDHWALIYSAIRQLPPQTCIWETNFIHWSSYTQLFIYAVSRQCPWFRETRMERWQSIRSTGDFKQAVAHMKGPFDPKEKLLATSVYKPTSFVQASVFCGICCRPCVGPFRAAAKVFEVMSLQKKMYPFCWTYDVRGKRRFFSFLTWFFPCSLQDDDLYRPPVRSFSRKESRKDHASLGNLSGVGHRCDQISSIYKSVFGYSGLYMPPSCFL